MALLGSVPMQKEVGQKRLAASRVERLYLLLPDAQIDTAE